MVASATAQSSGLQTKPASPTQPPKRSAYGSPKVSRPDAGSIQNSVYTNTYFKLRIPVPVGWNVHDEESKRRIMQTGNEEVVASQPEIAESLEKSLQRTLTLLAFDNSNMASNDGGVAALMAGAEPIPSGQTLTRGQYMETTKHLVLAVSGYELVEDIHNETIGGVVCSVMVVKRTLPVGTLQQKYASFIRNGYAVFIVTAYTNEAAGRTLDDIFNKIKLN